MKHSKPEHSKPEHRKPSRRHKFVLGALIGASVALGGGVAFAATRASGGPQAPAQMPAGKWTSAKISAPPTTVAGPTAAAHPVPALPQTAAPAPPTTTAPSTAPSTTTAPSITYTVKPGDTLSTIAAWFNLHGYGALYEANEAVIGDNPNLIFPGQEITITGGTMTLQQG